MPPCQTNIVFLPFHLLPFYPFRPGFFPSLLLPFQLPVVFPGLELQLAAAQVDLDVGELHQEQGELVAAFQVRTLVAMFDLPSLGTDPDGAVLQAPPILAAGAFRVGQEPFQALSELRQAETLRPGEAVEPDVGPELFQVGV